MIKSRTRRRIFRRFERWSFSDLLGALLIAAALAGIFYHLPTVVENTISNFEAARR